MTAAEACRVTMGNRRYPLDHWFGEIVETVQALCAGNYSEFKLEFEQVLWGLQIHIYQLVRIDFRLRFCEAVIAEGLFRRRVWQKIFESFGVPFNNNYLLSGSNYKKANKIQKALALAGVYITEKEASAICEKYYEITPDQI
jgi:hypothetical protein